MVSGFPLGSGVESASGPRRITQPLCICTFTTYCFLYLPGSLTRPKQPKLIPSNICLV